MTSSSRYPGYDVLAKRQTVSWDGLTRRVIEKRLEVSTTPRFFTPNEWRVADALCRRIVPQDAARAAVPLAALLDAKLFEDHGDGFREADMPYMREAWSLGLAALDAEARDRYDGQGFAELDELQQDALLTMTQQGTFNDLHWRALHPRKFFVRRVLVDVPALYYGHPSGWSEIGFGGPASPRGYVRLAGDRRDPWEAEEALPGQEDEARRLNQRVL